MQPFRHSKPVQQLGSDAGILKRVISENQGSDIRYRTIRQLIIFVHKEFSPIKDPVRKTTC